MWILASFTGVVVNLALSFMGVHDGWVYQPILNAFGAGLCFIVLVEAILDRVRP